MQWTYSLRNRKRWAGHPEHVEEHRRKAQETVNQLGIHDDTLALIAGAALVEIEIPFEKEEEGWALRVMPWEYLLATATRELRERKVLTIVRYLRVKGPQPHAARTPSRWHYVESAPGGLRDRYDFTAEHDLLKETVRLAKTASTSLSEPVRDPDVEGLTKALKNVRNGDVVHFAGFDSHDGLYRLHAQKEGDEALDGYLVRSPPRTDAQQGSTKPHEMVAVCTAQELARALCDDGHPLLVTFNIYHSAPRTAAMAVALGAEAAIGFADWFDDYLAEVFFTTFYREWSECGWDTVAAFQRAWHFVREQKAGNSGIGSGLVLWRRRSIRSVSLSKESTGTQKKRLKVTSKNVRDYLEVNVRLPPAGLNYSALHNGDVLFKSFTIRKKNLEVGRVCDLHVTVELHVGVDSYPYRTTVEVKEGLSHFDLADKIRISLTSSLARALKESVQTSLFVEVAWSDVVLYRETFQVALLPIDEWIDTDEQRIWLPSFVLPRDPAVLRVVAQAQRYLMAISDDPTMGFCGYQGVDDEGIRNSDEPADCCASVDEQVRAIWSALLYDLPLAYINPPPVFTEYSQRLRSPSDVVDNGRGTCIDLALLLASCLEYVEIYPVIFLLPDHAFPGYWRAEDYYINFANAMDSGESGNDARKVPGPGQRIAWQLGKENFGEIMAEVHAGRLVPLETVSLTERLGFAEAAEQGSENLTSRQHFQALLDITLARTGPRPVTPLPVTKA